MTGELNDKVAIITGAASGIGRASSLLFAQEGAKLVIADVSDGLQETAQMVRDTGGDVTAIQCDAGIENDVGKLVDAAVSQYGGLHAAFANAGIGGSFAGIFDHTVEDWQEVLRVNLIGPWLMVKHAGKYMADNGGGSIICTASVAGIRSGAGGPAYSASKAGVMNLVKVGAQQMATSNVRVNGICPGIIETGMTAPIYSMAREKGKEDKIGQLNPLRRGGEPIEIAQMALFLASDRASYVNGQSIAVDGGLSSSHPVTRQPFGQTAV